MSLQVTVSNITGTTPYSIYICDNPVTTCIYIDNISSGSLPYSFMIPDVMSSMSSYTLKIIDNIGCTTTQVLTP